MKNIYKKKENKEMQCSFYSFIEKIFELFFEPSNFGFM